MNQLTQHEKEASRQIIHLGKNSKLSPYYWSRLASSPPKRFGFTHLILDLAIHFSILFCLVREIANEKIVQLFCGFAHERNFQPFCSLAKFISL